MPCHVLDPTAYAMCSYLIRYYIRCASALARRRTLAGNLDELLRVLHVLRVAHRDHRHLADMRPRVRTESHRRPEARRRSFQTHAAYRLTETPRRRRPTFASDRNPPSATPGTPTCRFRRRKRARSKRHFRGHSAQAWVETRVETCNTEWLYASVTHHTCSAWWRRLGCYLNPCQSGCLMSCCHHCDNLRYSGTSM